MQDVQDGPHKARRGRAAARTKPVTIRFDVELWARLVDEAPLQRRSVGNLLQKLVADGLDGLADERAAQARLRGASARLPPGRPRQRRKPTKPGKT
jgi:hypothetical protein